MCKNTTAIQGRKERRKDDTRRYDKFIPGENMVQKLKENFISVSNGRKNYIKQNIKLH